MPIEKTAIDISNLSEDVKKALGPGKTMAARGLFPLQQPSDLATVLYQIHLDSDNNLAEAAQKTAKTLPPHLLESALSDPRLDSRVIDFFAGFFSTQAEITKTIVLNPNTSDTTVCDLAQKADEAQCELIAQNQQRLLRFPQIIGALYMNPKARMSTVDRCMELAVRNQISVPGIAAWDEVVAAVLGTQKSTPQEAAEADNVFRQIALDPTEPTVPSDSEMVSDDEEKREVGGVEDTRQLPVNQLSIPARIRLALVGNAFARSQLVRDNNRMVAMSAIRSPKVTDIEVVKYSANRSLNDEVIRVISNNRDWTRLYAVKHNLVQNPKCPLSTAMRFLPLLSEKDQRKVSKSKSVPSALAVQAKRLLDAKGGHKK